jgi:hypothetical protein
MSLLHGYFIHFVSTVKAVYNCDDELGGVWEEAFKSYFITFSWHLPGGTEETHENPQPEWPVPC